MNEKVLGAALESKPSLVIRLRLGTYAGVGAAAKRNKSLAGESWSASRRTVIALGAVYLLTHSDKKLPYR